MSTPETSATYRVYFTDASDGCPNQKLIQTDCPEDIPGNMANLGHTDVEYEMASCTLGGISYDLSVRIDRILLEAFATICSCVLNQTVLVNDLPKMYRTNPICHHEINKIIKGVK